MSTFIESYDFSGKTLAAFCTSASSATWLDGQRFPASASEEDVLAWANKMK